MAVWSNVAMASAVLVALAGCGGGEGEGSKEAESDPVAATSSATPSRTPQADVSSRSGEEWEEEQAAKLPKVTDVKVTETAEGDRVTFTFNAPAPRYLDSYEKELNGAEGKPITIEGSKFLRVAFIGVHPESRFTSPTPNERVLEVRYLMNFEGEMSAGIGIVAPDGAADPAYDISTEGTHVVIDIKE
ncbi:AMIN-like domain-containing (lipo)protein [Streptomyces rubiginosohelvolus]|uniref:AMIN-like domain-containing (lipo)protein n=1 Tax=Streptomyces rubiginosohelvolus TaxID=67362 RepID=UPI00381D20A8